MPRPPSAQGTVAGREGGDVAGPRARRAGGGAAAVLVALAGSLLTALTAQAAGPTPDASCQEMAGQRSLNDNTVATILFVNRSSVPVQTFWLNFAGQRVFYQRLAPGGSYTQRTWVTHPWIVADSAGTCLTFYVTAATSATVVVSDSADAGAATTGPTPPGTISSDAGGATAGASGAGVAAAPVGSTSGGSGITGPLVVAAVVAVAAAAAAAVAAAQGWLPGRGQGGSAGRPGSPLDAVEGGSPSGYDLAPTQHAGSPSGYDLAPTQNAGSPAGYDLAPTPPGSSPPGYAPGSAPPAGSPAGYDAAPTPPSTAPPGYEPPPAE